MPEGAKAWQVGKHGGRANRPGAHKSAHASATTPAMTNASYASIAGLQAGGLLIHSVESCCGRERPPV